RPQNAYHAHAFCFPSRTQALADRAASATVASRRQRIAFFTVARRVHWTRRRTGRARAPSPSSPPRARPVRLSSELLLTESAPHRLRNGLLAFVVVGPRIGLQPGEAVRKRLYGVERPHILIQS